MFRRALALTVLTCMLAAGPVLAREATDAVVHPAEGRILVAQNRDAAQLAVRLQQLEEQVRSLTGQIEGLQFQLTQMQTLLEKKAKDDEFRFQQLEGGGAAPPPAANALPQRNEERLMPSTPAPLAPEPPVLGDDEQPMDAHPLDDLGDSQDPMLREGGGEPALGQLGEGELRTPDGQPLNLTLANVDPSTDRRADADAQYRAAQDAIMRGEYEFAEEQFRQFIELYPSDARLPEATHWLGDALLQRQAYDEAAEVLLGGFQNYPDSPRAPDMLLKLGMALAGAEEPEAACRTYLEIDRRYSQTQASFRERLASEKARAQCPAG